jgi:hypothetical protein
VDASEHVVVLAALAVVGSVVAGDPDAADACGVVHGVSATRAAGEYVGAVLEPALVQEVVAVLTELAVVAAAPRELVCADTAAQPIATATTQQRVIACPTSQLVAELVAFERVGEVRVPQVLHAADGVLAVTFTLERVRGIEPPLSAWEADVLPLNYTRTSPRLTPGRAQTILAIRMGRRFGSSARGTAPEETEGGSSWIWSSGSWLRLSCW